MKRERLRARMCEIFSQTYYFDVACVSEYRSIVVNGCILMTLNGKIEQIQYKKAPACTYDTELKRSNLTLKWRTTIPFVLHLHTDAKEI